VVGAAGINFFPYKLALLITIISVGFSLESNSLLQTADIAQRIQQISGVEAVVLGGSRARGNAGADADVDLGIYYHPDRPPDLEALTRLAAELDDQHRPNLLTPLGGWGPWINGGGWLQISGAPVDFLYRDLAKVSRAITDCRAGNLQVDYQPGHPHCFTSAIYLAETAVCQPLTDPNGAIADLKKLATPYQPALRQALIERFFWEAGFSIATARKAASRGDAAYVTGCYFRCTACLLQTLFALNEQYWLNEKGALAQAAGFARTAPDLEARVHSAAAALGPDPRGLSASLEIMDDLIRTVAELIHV
jgi:predicted nucleotidyltransferase